MGRRFLGVSAPDGTLHVMTASGGTITPGANSDDLIVESIDLSADELRAGDNFVATVKVANIGSSDQEDIRVRFKCSDLDISILSDFTDVYSNIFGNRDINFTFRSNDVCNDGRYKYR